MGLKKTKCQNWRKKTKSKNGLGKFFFKVEKILPVLLDGTAENISEYKKG